MPLPSLNLAAPSNATSGASGESRLSSGGGSGLRNSPQVNIAFPGASLSAETSADGGPKPPWWAWLLILAGGGLLLWRLGKGGGS
jgi:hypothetical protein